MVTESQRALLRTHGVLVGRTLIGLLFLVSGVFMLKSMGVAGVTAMLAGLGVPAAGLVAVIMLLTKIGGGACLVLGYKTDHAAIALLVFTFFTIILVHNNMKEMTSALKNLSVMGGLLYVLAYGAGDGWKLCASK